MKIRILIGFAACAALCAQAPADKGWSILKAAAEDKSAERRGRAMMALALVGNNHEARAMAEKGLSDEKEDVRAAAAQTLGRMGSKESIPKLKELAKDSSFSVVMAATNALAELNDPAAFAVYYAILTGEKKTGESLGESQMKMLKDPKALMKMGFEQGIGFVPFGGVSYQVFKTVTKDDTSPVRAAAAVRLAVDPDPKTMQALQDTTKDKKWLVRAAVISSLAKRDDPAALAVITPLMDDENEVVKLNAAAAVIRLSAAPGHATSATKK